MKKVRRAKCGVRWTQLIPFLQRTLECTDESFDFIGLLIISLKVILSDITNIKGSVQQRLDLDSRSPCDAKKSGKFNARVAVETLCDIGNGRDSSPAKLIPQSKIFSKYSNVGQSVYLLYQVPRLLPGPNILKTGYSSHISSHRTPHSAHRTSHLHRTPHVALRTSYYSPKSIHLNSFPIGRSRNARAPRT